MKSQQIQHKNDKKKEITRQPFDLELDDLGCNDQELSQQNNAALSPPVPKK